VVKMLDIFFLKDKDLTPIITQKRLSRMEEF